MSNKILVTDTLFIFDEHVKKLEDAGYQVERLEKPEATEEELIKAIKGKVGYILGGIEKVTEKVVQAADELKVIIFTGADWKGFIPGHELATKKGIAIANTPGANTNAVAEYTITLMLAMLRRIFELGSTGSLTFKTTDSLADVTIGIVGMGRIGEAVARMLKNLGAKDIIYWNRHRKPELEQSIGVEYFDLDELFSRSDIVSNHLSSGVGKYFLGKELLAKLRDESLIVNTGFHDAFDMDKLYEELKKGRLRAVFDSRTEGFKDLPLSNWFSSNEGTAFNTNQANQRASDMATLSMINLLKTNKDEYRAN